MRVAFFNATDRGSGAEALINQTVSRLIERGVDARLYVLGRSGDAAHTHRLNLFPGERRLERLFRRITGRHDLLFPYTWALTQDPWIREARLWHFHNLHGHWISLPLLARESRHRRIVLSPVDQYLSTGYCPYTLGCERYRSGCGRCPQLGLRYPGIERDTTRELLRMKKRAFRRSRFEILVHTDFLANHYRSTFVGRRPIERIRYGVDTQVFRPMDRDLCARTLGLARSDRFVVGLMHSFIDERRKGLLGILDQLAGLAERRSLSIEALVVGRASELAKRHETERLRITTLPFLESEQQLAMALNLCDLLVYPTQAENLSMTCLDALACGVPVLSTSVGGQPEAIQHGVNGFLASPDANGAFLDPVGRMLDDPALRQLLGENARRSALAEFDLDRYVDQLMAYYARLDRS